MTSNIVIVSPAAAPAIAPAISIEEFQKRRLMRRRRVAKRMLKRFPLFAVEIMQSEFPGYTLEEFEADVTRKTRKGKSFRRPKTPLIRQGRYDLYRAAMANFRNTGDQTYLQEAQRLRNRMFLPFLLVYALRGQQKHYQFPSTTSWKTIEKLKNLKGYNTWDELDAAIKEATKWSHIS